jgi:hypothetical protein
MLLLSPFVTKVALGDDVGRAAEGVRVVGEVAVDLVETMSRSWRSAIAQTASTVAAAGCVPVGLSGSVRTRIPGRRPSRGAAASAASSASGSGMPPASGPIGTRSDALAGERGVRGVADPRRLRDDDVAGQHREQRVDQRLAAGANRICSGVVGPRRAQYPAAAAARLGRPADRP